MSPIEAAIENGLLVSFVEKVSPFEMQDLKMICLSATFWLCFYVVVTFLPVPLKNKFGPLSKQDELDIQNRVVSTVHGTILMLAAGYQFYFFPGQCGDTNSQYEKNLLYCSIGYFTYDFIIMAYYGLLDRAMVLHHTVTASGMSVVLIQGMTGNMVVGGMFIAEVSNPAMHVRVMLKLLGLRYSKAYESCEIAMILLYTFGRIILGSY